LKWVTSIYIDGDGASLKNPEGVACTDDHLLVADTGNNRLLQYTYQGESVMAEAEIPLPKARPIRVQMNTRGDIYFLDGRERRIESIDASGESTGVLKPRSVPYSTEVVPKSFAIDRRDNIYILDIHSENVLVLDAEGQYTRHLPFPKKYGFFSDVAVDAAGTIFLLDGVDAVVYSAEVGADRFSPLTESLKEYMNYGSSLAVDRRGVLYLVDQYGSGLALVGPDGAFLGRRLRMGWDEAGLHYPSQLCISSNGNVFIADRSNNRVQRFLQEGTAPKATTEEATSPESEGLPAP